MKKLISVILIVIMLISMLPMNVFAANASSTNEFAGGSGTKEDPYLIETKYHLDNIRNHLDAHFKLMCNIEFTDADFAEGGSFYNNGFGWNPIATGGISFTGDLDGNNYLIQGLTANIYESPNEELSYGLFGNISRATVKNLKMKETTILVNNNHYIYAGCISGSAFKSIIDNCSAEGVITAKNSNESCALYAGGIIGQAVSSTVTNVESTVNIKSEGNDRIGGICGHISSGSVLNATNRGVLQGTTATGGIAGEASNSSIKNGVNYSALSSISSQESINNSCDCGGTVAWMVGKTTVTRCSNYAKVSSYSTIQYGSTAAGIVATIIADKNDNALVSNCYNNGEISAGGATGSNAGGISGTYYFSTIRNCYNSGKINSVSNAGGIVSFSQGATIETCYNVGDITATYVGGIVGEKITSIFDNCIYKDSVPNACGKSTLTLKKCTSEEMQQKATYTDWDFENTWEFVEGNAYQYPTLKNNEYFLIDENSEFQGGNGTESSPYLIASTKQLNNVHNHLEAYFKLVRDIEFTDADFAEGGSFYNKGQGWNPIGSKANAFTGVFDGNGFNIENLYINLSLNSDAYIGLFGYSKGEINSLGVIATNYVVDASNKNAYVGGIVGYSKSNISNCSAEGKINVESTSSIANEIIVGGIVGTLGADKLININSCFNDCDITVIRKITSTATSGGVATTSAGGVIGETTSDTMILNCNNAGNIYTTYKGGQLVDIVSGGILGKSWFNTSVLDSCYNYGNIIAYSPDVADTINNHAGGIAGDAYSLKITKCYNTGNISSNHNSGGIFANTTSSVESETTDCFNVGNISSGFSSGGIGGSTEATITNCYNIGFVEGKIYGGIVGFNNGGNATVTNCFYWDIVDNGVGNWNDTAVKCSLSELKKSETYQGFDFENIWTMDGSQCYPYPKLKNLYFESDHVFNNACDTDCNCGFTRTVSHNYELKFDDENHFEKCSVCDDVTNTETHKFDNACDTTCDCGYVRTVPAHKYDNSCDTSCNICGKTRTITHMYNNACDTDCNVCGATRTTEHKYDNTCDTTCNICGAVHQITHKYSEYLYNYDATSDKDGTKTRECSVCKKQETVTAKGTKLVNSAKKFKDVSANAWYKKFVDFAVTNKIFNGMSDTTFAPEQNMTRAQFVQVFANISGVDTSNRNVNSGFSDVPKGKWYTAAVTWAAQNGIVNGVGDGRFDPNAKVTREQMCVMIVNYIEKYQGKSLKITVNAPAFADDNNISGWAKVSVYKCARAGLVNGVGNNRFDPKASATRAQGATLFTNFYKEYMK